ncbi:MAG: hypothetical protein CL609_23610 [Anaerolineaceae bacterium]|nr:hypothetical protein [Anaerolineaceae bacterium]
MKGYTEKDIKLWVLIDKMRSRSGKNDIVFYLPADGVIPQNHLFKIDVDSNESILNNITVFPENKKINAEIKNGQKTNLNNSVNDTYEFNGTLLRFYNIFCKDPFNSPRPIYGQNQLTQAILLATPTVLNKYDQPPIEGIFVSDVINYISNYFNFSLLDSIVYTISKRVFKMVTEEIPFSDWAKLKHVYWVGGEGYGHHRPLTDINKDPMFQEYYIDTEFNFCLCL